MSLGLDLDRIAALRYDVETDRIGPKMVADAEGGAFFPTERIPVMGYPVQHEVQERIDRLRTFIHIIHNPVYKIGRPHYAVRGALAFADLLGDDLRDYAVKVGKGREWLEKHPDAPDYRARWDRWAGWWNTYLAVESAINDWAECPRPTWEEA
jgi:hypothetical protein